MKITATTILLLAVAHTAWAWCRWAEEELEYSYRTATLRPKGGRSGYKGGQRCEFILPSAEFNDRLLLLYIKEVYMAIGRNITGDIQIGEGIIFSEKMRANCRLHGKGAETMSPSAIEAIVGTDYECNAWTIDEMPVKTITFRSFGEKDLDFEGNFFFIKYQYIPFATTEVTVTTSSDTQGTTRSSEQVEATKALSPASPATTGGCPSTIIYIVLIVILLVLLVLTWLYILYQLYRKKMHKRKLRIARGSFFQSESIDEQLDEQPSTSQPYATIGESTRSPTIHNNSSYVGTPPTSRGVRSPTSASRPGDPHYQVPKPRSPGILSNGESHYATAVGNASPAPNPADVYAVVMKDKS